MKLRSFIGALIAWSIIGVVHGLSRYADMIKYNPNGDPSLTGVFLYVLSYSFWIVLTLILLYALKKIAFPFAFKTLIGIFVIGLFCWLPPYFSVEYAVATMISGGANFDFLANLESLSSSVIFFYSVVYALTFAACLGIVLAEKTILSNRLNASLKQRRTEDALMLSQQKMQLMQSQLSPHFLFNCLGAISGLARNRERDTIVDATARVGDLLRFTISNSDVHLITIDEELSFVEDYVALQKLRFGERFSFSSTVTLPRNQLMCPPFTIQPLVENSFCHAVEITDATVSIDFSVSYDQNSLIVLLTNTLVSDAPKSNGNGTGLRNLQSRLTHLFGDRYTLCLNSDDSVFNVKLSLPLDTEEQ